MKLATVWVATCLAIPFPAWAQASAGSSAAADSGEAKRARELRIPEIIAALAAKEGSHIADIGAGDGLYEGFLCRAVGSNGRIYAEDIDEKNAIQRLKERAEKDHLDNLTVILGEADNPKLPQGELDGVLMVISYHEITDYQKVLGHVASALKPGGRIVIVDMPPHKTLSRPRADQVKNHVIAPDLVESEVRQAGFDVIERDDHFVDRPDEESTRYMIVFRKPVRQ